MDHPDEQIGARDVEVLAGLAELYDVADPVPEGLVERLGFALALDEVMAEVAELTRMPADTMAVRGEAAAVTRAETITFSAEALTAMVAVVRLGHGRVRLDGWLAPGSVMQVRLRSEGDRRSTVSEASGRFSFDGLAEGFVQLSFHPAEPDDADAVVITPLFEL